MLKFPEASEDLKKSWSFAKYQATCLHHSAPDPEKAGTRSLGVRVAVAAGLLGLLALPHLFPVTRRFDSGLEISMPGLKFATFDPFDFRATHPEVTFAQNIT